MQDGFSGERALVLPQIIMKKAENDMLLSQLHVTDIGYYPNARHHYRIRETPVDQYIFIYCTDGKGMYEIDGKTYRVHADQYFILPKGIPHRYGADKSSPWTIYWIHFKGKLAPYYFTGDTGPEDLPPSSDSRIRDRLDIFEEMYRTLESGFSIDNLRYTTSLLHHFLGSLQYIRQYRQAKQYCTWTAGMSATVIHFMKENIEKAMSLAEIASYAGLSASHFSMIFRQETGHSPMSYFNLLKIQKACQLLDTTDMKINQICHKTGISDTYYFSRLFTKVMGISPSKYRKTSKG